MKACLGDHHFCAQSPAESTHRRRRSRCRRVGAFHKVRRSGPNFPKEARLPAPTSRKSAKELSLSFTMNLNSNCLQAYAGSAYIRLRSSASTRYELPALRRKIGERAFWYSGPASWNSLPSDITSIMNTPTFRPSLKIAYL